MKRCTKYKIDEVSQGEIQKLDFSLVEQRKKEARSSNRCNYWKYGCYTCPITCIPSVAHGKKMHIWGATSVFRLQASVSLHWPWHKFRHLGLSDKSKTSLSSPLFLDTSSVSRHWGFQHWKHLYLGITEHLILPPKPELFLRLQSSHSLISHASRTQCSRFSQSMLRTLNVQD